MPKSHLFSVFGFRNPSKEIFSELDKINAQGPIFARSFQKSEGEMKWGHEAPPQQGGAAQPLAARPWHVEPSCGPLTCPSAYLKPPSRNPRQINSSSVAAATRPPLFDGMHYKRWRTKAVLWFTNLGCFSATDARPEGPLSAEEQEKFEKVDAMFKAALFNILGDNIVDPYMAFDHGKDVWDALEAKFGVSDAGTELYVMEQYYDYKMTDTSPTYR
ncbi:hypothetical protein QYE76_044774 [Lolium multiflorum]|uniref:Uncharacterized protein n=1 Tax=Lolium multiflorum TaxID=4521 RepID=A0AAD8WZ65_LOLMU|nr:hypothetical protein QYE76_044774 [Lolium multiflorum]